MTYETLRSIYVIAGIASLVMLAVTIGLFFMLKIPEAVAFVSGKTRKMGIEAIERTGTVGTRKLSGKSKQLSKKSKAPAAPAKGSGPVRKADHTDEKLTDVLPTDTQATAVLSVDGRSTTVLQGNAGGSVPEAARVDHRNLVFTQQPFVVEFDITYVYSDIVIGEV